MHKCSNAHFEKVLTNVFFNSFYTSTQANLDRMNIFTFSNILRLDIYR